MDWRASALQLRGRLLASLGLIAAACSTTPAADDEGGVTTNPGGDDTSDDEGSSSTSTSTTASTSASTFTTGDGDGDDDGETDTESETDDDPPEPKLDLPPEPDLPPVGDCTTTLESWVLLDDHPTCGIVAGDSPCEDLYMGCVPLVDGMSCDRLCPDGDCVDDWMACSGDPLWDMPSNVCGPFEHDGQCCSIAELESLCGTDGRPFVVAGVTRLAALELEAVAVDRVHAAVARRFVRAARAEHASIASFARFATALLAHGAPAGLVRDAIRAAADEVRHAVLTAELAAAGGSQWFGPLDTRGAAEPETLAELVRACVREGCIGETLAALELATAARFCEDPALAAIFEAIAEDESRHSALAWRFVQWALGQDPRLVAELAAEVDALAVPSRGPAELEAETEPEFEEDGACLRAHGCLSVEERRRVRRVGILEIVRPCAAALLAQFGGPGSRLRPPASPLA